LEREKTSVLLVSTILNTGGAERFVSTLLEHLDRSRLEPSLCLLRDNVGYPIPKDVEVRSLGFKSSRQFPAVVRRLRQVLEDERPDVVLSSINATGIAVGLALRSSSYKPVWIARIGNNPTLADRGLRRFLARQVLPLADHFVVNAHGLLKELETCYPFTKGRISVLGNPTDFARLDELAAADPGIRNSSGEPLLIAVGRLFRQKRYDIMLRALAQVRKEMSVRLWVCGEGSERGSLTRKVRRLGLSDSVQMLGFCENPFALMSRADLFVMSSEFEGLPNALIEAQGLGLAAVSTSCPHGPEEIIDDGETGLLVPVNDVHALATAILGLLRQREKTKRMGTAARQRIRVKYGVAPLIQDWEQLILSTSRGHHPGVILPGPTGPTR
jgi:glycosyltransferase involved in cell wall biosynthesis